MKTKFTIRRLIFTAFTIGAIALSSCTKDEETPKFDVSGEYTLQSAVLVDGNVNDTDAASNLFIGDGLYLLGSQGDVDVPAGETQITTGFVDAVLRGAAPCKDADLTSWTYKIDLSSTGGVAFVCTSEGDVSDDLGTYSLLENNTVLSMSISVSFSPIPITITISDLVQNDDGSLTGTVESFPMLRYAFYGDGSLMLIGGPIDGDITNTSPDNLNVQYLSATITLAKVN